jgi:hypothetical protein
MKSHSLAIQIGATVGIIGLFVMGANTWAGIAVILVGAAIVALSFLTPMSMIEKVISPPAHRQRQVTNPLKQAASVNPKGLSLLKRTLYQANLDPRASVLVGNNNQVILTMQDILVKMIQTADAHGLTIPELAKDITRIYPRIFGNSEQASARYPRDKDRIAGWLAERALKDVRKELDVQK